MLSWSELLLNSYPERIVYCNCIVEDKSTTTTAAQHYKSFVTPTHVTYKNYISFETTQQDLTRPVLYSSSYSVQICVMWTW